MRFAVIDLGTNTFNLLIAESDPDKTFKKILNTKIAVKLGEGAINSGYIADPPFQRGIHALKQFQQYLLDYQVSKTYAFATSAIRSAKNGEEFVLQAKQVAGIVIHVIDGNEEADLIYHGNNMAVKMTDDVSLIMDIGGGSNEFVLANRTTIFWKQSFLLGAARLLEKFNHSDPIAPNEIVDFNVYIKKEMQPLLEAIKQFKPIELIGSSGAFESVVDIIAGKFGTSPIDEIKTEYLVDLNQYKIVSEYIKSTTIKERHSVNGLIEMRVDMMVISFLLIDFILKECHIDAMRVSTFSLKEGIISKIMGLSHR